jgi:hypothetical protein
LRDVRYKTNWRVKAIFSIGVHIKDIAILESIKFTLGVGNIHKHGKYSVQYRVESIKELQVIIDHFDKYNLITAKLSDYLLFKKALNLIKFKEHLIEDGLLKLIAIKSSINLGLPDNLKKAFPTVVSIERPKYIFNKIIDSYWLAGFSSGDGSFDIKISSSKTSKLGSRVQLRFSIGLNIREIGLIKYLVTYFNLGYSTDFNTPTVKEDNIKYVYTTDNSVNLQVVNFSDITEKIIPFFDKYPIQGNKSLDYYDFKKVANIIKNKEHLTSEGFNNIINIKSGMNRGRI